MGIRRPHRFLATLSLLMALQFSAPDVATAASAESTPQQVFDGMTRSFRPEKAKGLRVRYQFDLSGPNGGAWVFDVDNGTLRTRRGRADNPDVTLITSDDDWVALSNGKLSGTWAYVTGRLKIRGDKGLAKKLGEIFP
jgi:putative sterol carrier protein